MVFYHAIFATGMLDSLVQLLILTLTFIWLFHQLLDSKIELNTNTPLGLVSVQSCEAFGLCMRSISVSRIVRRHERSISSVLCSIWKERQTGGVGALMVSLEPLCIFLGTFVDSWLCN